MGFKSIGKLFFKPVLKGAVNQPAH